MLFPRALHIPWVGAACVSSSFHLRASVFIIGPVPLFISLAINLAMCPFSLNLPSEHLLVLWGRYKIWSGLNYPCGHHVIHFPPPLNESVSEEESYDIMLERCMEVKIMKAPKLYQGTLYFMKYGSGELWKIFEQWNVII